MRIQPTLLVQNSIDLFKKEKEYLLPTGSIDLLRNYESCQTRIVSIESMITFSECEYSKYRLNETIIPVLILFVTSSLFFHLTNKEE